MRFTFSFEILRLGWSGGVLLCHSDKVGRFKDDCGRGVESPKDYYGLCRIFTDAVACIRLLYVTGCMINAAFSDGKMRQLGSPSCLKEGRQH